MDYEEARGNNYMRHPEMTRTAGAGTPNGPKAGSVVMEKNAVERYSRKSRCGATLIAMVFGAHSQLLTAIDVVFSAMKIGSRLMVWSKNLPAIVEEFTPS